MELNTNGGLCFKLFYFYYYISVTFSVICYSQQDVKQASSSQPCVSDFDLPVNDITWIYSCFHHSQYLALGHWDYHHGHDQADTLAHDVTSNWNWL